MMRAAHDLTISGSDWSPGGDMSTGNDRAWRALLAAGIVVMAAYVVAPGGRVQAVVFLGWLTLAAGLLIGRLRRDRRPRPWLWQALVAGVGVYVVAAYLWYLPAIGFGPKLPFPSVLDVLFFVSYVLVGSYLLATIGRRRADDEGEQRLAVVDAAIFTNALLALVWVAIIQPNIAAAGGTAAKVVAVAYPAFTALLFGLAMRIVLGGIVPRGVDLLLVGWIGAELCSSIIYGYTSVNSTFRHGHPVFLGWIGSYTALAALAVHPAFATVPRHAVRAPRTSSRSRLALLLAAALLPIAVAIIDGADLFLLVDAAVGFVLVTARLSLVSGDLEEQRRLARELARMSDELRHRALHDSLTGLGNRALVMEALERAIRRRTTTPGVGTALVLLDLDGFKTINDTLGHQAGDDVLIEVATRLLGSVRSADTVARLGGDEFAVILEEVSTEDALRSARRIIEVLREPVQFSGKTLAICASVGLHMMEEASDTQIAVRNADLAMYAAKALGGDRYELYQAELHHAFLVRHELEMQLREAVGGAQLQIYYQPIVDLTTEAFAGATQSAGCCVPGSSWMSRKAPASSSPSDGGCWRRRAGSMCDGGTPACFPRASGSL
jgi:diguanylate cyclase (GGDEF)-like protein